MGLRKIVFALAAIVLFANPAGADPIMSPAQFRDAVIARVSEMAPDAQITLRGDLGFDVKQEGGDVDSYQVNVDYAYGLYQQDPSRFDDLVDRWARVAFGLSDRHIEPESLVAIIRPRSMVSDFLAQSREDASVDMVWRTFAGDLALVLAFDSPEQLAYARHSDLDELGISEEDAWTQAVRNIPERLGAIERTPVANGLESVTGPNGLAPSMLSAPAFCANPDIAGHFFIVADRNLFLEADAVWRAHIAEVAADLSRSGGSFSATVLQCIGGQMTALPQSGKTH